MSHVTIDGRDFELDKLSRPARQQAMNINLVDQEIRRPASPAGDPPNCAQRLRDRAARRTAEGSVRNGEIGCEYPCSN
jgi:hypothetical protein